MKQLILFVMLAFCITSCSKSEDNLNQLKEYEFPQKWVLVQMSGDIPNSVTTGDQMSWQEYYLLKQDGTFTKSRTMDGVSFIKNGTYAFDLRKEGNYLITTFSEANILVATCHQGLSEELWLQTNTKAVSSWSQCDGPGLIYERTQ